MTVRTFVLSILCVALIAAGQLLFKLGAVQWRADAWSWDAVQSFFSGRMALALVIYAIATVLWVYVLRTAPLASAYLVFSLAFLIVPLLSHFLLGERIGVNTLVGGGLIVAGIVVAAR